MHKIITEALPKSVGSELIGLVNSRDEIPDLLKLNDVIDLVIPRGSNKVMLMAFVMYMWTKQLIWIWPNELF